MPEEILIVDNSPANRKLTQRVLAGAGYSARCVEDAETALQVLPGLQPRLVLTDLGLPGMDGFDLVRRIKQDPRTRHAAVIALTGYSSDEDRRKASEAGCDGFVMKPIDTRTFPGLVEAQLAKRPRNVVCTAVAGQFSPDDLPAWAAGLCQEFQRQGRNFTGESQGLGDEPGDRSQLQRSARLSAGLAASLGYPDIATLARRLENLLEHPGGTDTPELGSLLRSLGEAFSGMSIPVESAADPAPLSPALTERLSRKRVALVGLDVPAASRVCEILSAAGAEALVGESGDLSACDLVLADGAALTRGRLLELLSTSSTPILLLGAAPGDLPQEILGNSALLDFVAAPWVDEELAARACRLIANRPAGNESLAGLECRRAPTVVLADDDPTSLTILKSTLESYGVECRTADEGEQALKLIQAAPPDIAILDVMMPNLDGFELLAAIRNDKSLKDVRIIMLTALQQENDVVRGFGLGADDYIIKPFSPVELYARLKRLLRKQS